ncbi:hypothetical protein [Actomonas aquatica]|uniref:Response regulatory domain-containing protein n=1 Tax=Actomonas aquatica TaxID=2866162 RepID=A0ABZ1CHJ2_9BACT|nr:hypothetical protein [Opitutus sp. WL0086]WRQ90054.1 hypothetical protein K1X11_011600 [Opitutus sp. WL0086]
MPATTPHILIMHADAHLRRVLAVLLVEAGMKVKAVEAAESAVEEAVAESFDLILIGYQGVGEQAFAWAGRLRDELGDEPPIVMLLPELQLPLVVQGIREGLTDVWPLNEEVQPVVRRVLALVAPERVEGVATTPAVELSEVERTLREMEPVLRSLHTDAEAVEMRERFKRALLELEGERDLVEAAQAAMDERARMLADERQALDQRRRKMADEAKRLERARAELRAECDLWQQTLQDLQTREGNLRDYEARLRQRESLLPGKPSIKSVDTGYTQLPFPPATAGQGWEDLAKARAVFEAEKNVFRDERMALGDLDQQIRKREERLRELERQLQEKDRVRRGLPPPPPDVFEPKKTSGGTAAPFKRTSRIRGIFRR